MKFVSINVADSFKKGAPKKIFINLDNITAVEKTSFGTVPNYRIILSTPGSATPPKEEKYPKSFFEPYSYSVSQAQGEAILAQINALVPIIDICVDMAGNDDAPTAAAAPSVLGF